MSPSIAEFAEAASLTQAVESLLFDQLQNLRLDPLTELTDGQQKTHVRSADLNPSDGSVSS